MGEQRHLDCIICGKTKEADQGIVIVSEFICGDCEAEMVETDVRDAKYSYFIHQMKQIFIEKNA
ncbi:sigma factor G inhibitor Gin [Paenibacillus protaetiae]|uniref:Inhibitor of sigma-G Gin n=1 Tax=Paenibacillus protaetiae TaxID=2509456 RepID=A0A4P6EYZ1_9BACL|nr:sigma factor G inhibitor Gin [Paenibacillus protaetiae]QAY67483.1 inhibitor of sigma-G Gin [Paenibacillus protaetiae]